MPNGHFGPVTSLIMVFVVMIGAPVVLFIVQRILALWHRRRGAASDASYEARAFVAPGPAVLHGQVEYAEGEDCAVTTAITQTGTEAKGKSGWTHTWTEVDRQITVAPFYLVRLGGDRTRIEPDEHVMLVDTMDVTQPGAGHRRTRIAQLTPGETIFAIGELVEDHDPRAAADYRGKTKSLVLRPPAHTRMLLSSEPLGERFRQRGAFHAGFSIATVVLAVFMQLFAIPYHVRFASGREATGTLVSKRHFTTRSKSGTTDHWELTLETSDGIEFTDEVSWSHYRRIERGEVVPIIVVPWWEGRERVGRHVTIAIVIPIVFMVLFSILVGIYIAAVRTSRPWYERKLVESGNGRLPAAPQ